MWTTPQVWAPTGDCFDNFLGARKQAKKNAKG
jgi:hypothetical protein